MQKVITTACTTRQLALEHFQAGALRVDVQLAADLADLHLPGLELGQASGFLRDQDVLHLLKEG